MKKKLVIILTLVLLMSTALPVFAANTVTNQTYGNLYEKFNDLKDVDLGSSAPSLAKAVEAGIFKGNGSGNLEPFKPTSGTELVVVLLRTLNLSGNSTEPAKSLDGVPKWATNDIQTAISTGLLEEDDPILTEGISKVLTRFEAIAFLAKALGLQPDYSASPFTDADDPYITALYKAGLVAGYGNGILGADKPLTRAELAIFVDRILQYL